jgi:hypothetical protein
MDQMLDIDLGPLEPMPGVDGIPQHGEAHGAAVDETGVVHVEVVEVLALCGGEAQDGDDERDPADGDRADRFGEAAEIPRARAELVAHDEELERDGEDERRVLRNGADAEDGADGDRGGEHEQTQQGADADDEPDGVDGRLGVAVHLLPPAAAREGAVAGIGVDDAGGGDGAAAMEG